MDILHLNEPMGIVTFKTFGGLSVIILCNKLRNITALIPYIGSEFIIIIANLKRYVLYKPKQEILTYAVYIKLIIELSLYIELQVFNKYPFIGIALITTYSCFDWLTCFS